MTSPEPPVSTDPERAGIKKLASTASGTVQRNTQRARRHVEGTAADTLWNRLNALGFINEAMIFASILLLVFFPFLIVMSALAGRSVTTSLARRLGLNHQAAGVVGHLFNSTSATSNAVTVTGVIFLVFGVIGMAGALQGLYEKVFHFPARGMKDVHRLVGWLAILCATSVLAGWLGPSVRRAGGPVLLAIIALAFNVAFWWWTIHFLLSARIPWRELLPSAVATAVCWIGLGVFSKFLFSTSIVNDYRQYGNIGTVFALMSWLIAVGVVIILGAVFGIVWRDAHLARYLTRKGRRKDPATPEPSIRSHA